MEWLINKTIMTYGSNSAVTKEINAKNKEVALRIFITDLNGKLANKLYIRFTKCIGKNTGIEIK